MIEDMVHEEDYESSDSDMDLPEPQESEDSDEDRSAEYSGVRTSYIMLLPNIQNLYHLYFYIDNTQTQIAQPNVKRID